MARKPRDRNAEKARFLARLAADDPTVRHGVVGTYRRGCRCDNCLTAVREYERKRWRRSNIAMTRTAEHGTQDRYALGCRCGACTDAHRLAHMDRRHRNYRLSYAQIPAEHGKRSTYSYWGCRCDPCTESQRAYQAWRNVTRRRENA